VIDELKLASELRAQQAEHLPSFDSFNLLGVKRKLAELLSLIGRDGIFDEYTKHDIAHVDAALENLEWLIPDATKDAMTPADWLLTVLAIYFHDLGMLVTKHEFDGRESSGFPDFRDRVLFAGQDGTDYRAKTEQLKPDERERFLYQEFVRNHHAERIRNWVVGKAPDHLGATVPTVAALEELLNPLSERFRKDLALVCESHHLDDLKDFKKSPLSQPYGKTSGEQANVHYAVLLLRTADLLDITTTRTPSILYRVIDPKDPTSQDEWAKQMGVIAVRPKLGLNADGFPDDDAVKDTIEVHALYRRETGFFGLTSYLAYVRDQLAKSYDAATLARRTQASMYDFPWRDIDDSKIETEGFIRETFEFKLDQARILDLLTGHTLYNDTSVVLRELVQNAIDAVRLQHHIDVKSTPSTEPGSVQISWDSQQRLLTVRDGGTGMTQDTIERHLLTVGAVTLPRS
jgi:molecular chaperone HtpG